jgi:hypothetical protein
VRGALAALLLAGLLLPGCVEVTVPEAQPAQDDGMAQVTVSVVDAATGDGLRGAAVRLLLPAKGAIGKQTDSAGQARFTVEPVAACTLSASRAGYEAGGASIGCDSDRSYRLPLRAVAGASARGPSSSGPAPGPGPSASVAANQSAPAPPSAQNLTELATGGFPSPCRGRSVPDETAAAVPIAAQHCVAPADLTVSGRDLGFADGFAIDWVRPGINLGPCSTSFLLVDDAGDLFLTQSAHCIFATEGADFCASTYTPVGDESVIEGYAGSPATVAWVSGEHMKEFGGTPEECSTWDVSIHRVPDDLRTVAHPAIRHIGGPTGLADPLDLRQGDPVAGYGNSDDRGAAVEIATGDDHGNAPVWPAVNEFSGTFVGAVLDEAYCPTLGCDWESRPYGNGLRPYIRYVPTKITGDSGSADLTGDGKALGVTSVINFATALMGTTPIYDTLLRIWQDTGVRYRVVTWDEWSPTTIET